MRIAGIDAARLPLQLRPRFADDIGHDQVIYGTGCTDMAPPLIHSRSDDAEVEGPLYAAQSFSLRSSRA